MGRMDSVYDDGYDGDGPNTTGLWESAMRRAITSARGQGQLRALREHMMALPVHALAYDRMADPGVGLACAVGEFAVMQRMRKGETRDQALRAIRDETSPGCGTLVKEREHTSWGGGHACHHKETEHAPGGACLACVAKMAEFETENTHPDYRWIETPCPGFTEPTDVDYEDEPVTAYATAEYGVANGMRYTLAWVLEDVNDQIGDDPETRFDRVITWIDRHLKEPVPA
jgi:hypothetical protein